MKRVRLTPRAVDIMDDGARFWLWKYAKNNYWRVAAWMDLEDLIQDGHCLWISTRRRYTDAVLVPHVMRLFQVTFVNHVHDLARAHSMQHETPFSQIDEESMCMITNLKPCEFADLLRLMAEAPGNLRSLLIALHNNPEPLRWANRRYIDGTRLSDNDRMAAALGQPRNPGRRRSYVQGLRTLLKEKYV